MKAAGKTSRKMTFSLTFHAMSYSYTWHFDMIFELWIKRTDLRKHHITGCRHMALTESSLILCFRFLSLCNACMYIVTAQNYNATFTFPCHLMHRGVIVLQTEITRITKTVTNWNWSVFSFPLLLWLLCYSMSHYISLGHLGGIRGWPFHQNTKLWMC